MGPKDKDGNVGCDTILCRSCDGVTDLQEVHKSDTCLVILSMFGKITACSCHVTYAFESKSTLYSGLNVKELLARCRREI